MARLIWQPACGGTEVIPLRPDRGLSIGRSEENDLVLPVEEISRRHCRLEPLPDGDFRLVDLQSTNGTFLNGEQVERVVLDFDDWISLGDRVLVFADDASDPRQVLAQHAPVPWVPLAAPAGQADPADLARAETISHAAQLTTRTVARPPLRGRQAQLRALIPHLSLLGQRAGSREEFEELAAKSLSGLLRFSGCQHGLLLLSPEGGGTHLEAAMGLGADGQALELGQRRFTQELVDEALHEQRLARRERAICVPLRVAFRMSRRERRRSQRRPRCLGAIYLESEEPLRPLDGEDLLLIDTVAAQLAPPLQRALLQHQAKTDRLTGLDNRLAMEEVFAEEVAWAHEDGTPLAVIMVDLDHFKRVNDTHGHSAGDEVLRRVAQRMRRALRGEDFVSRWGGEEFLILLPGEGLEGARDVAEKLRQTVAARPFGEARLRLSASLGVATFPRDGRTMDELVGHADAALYAAKAAGRNRVVLYRPDLEMSPPS